VSDPSGPRGLWLQHVPPTTAPGAAVYAYTHGINSSELSWPALLREGSQMIKALLELIESTRVRFVKLAAIFWTSILLYQGS
jgi:hypothetical protein